MKIQLLTGTVKLQIDCHIIVIPCTTTQTGSLKRLKVLLHPQMFSV